MFEELGVIYPKLGVEEGADAEAGDRVQSGLNGVHNHGGQGPEAIAAEDVDGDKEVWYDSVSNIDD